MEQTLPETSAQATPHLPDLFTWRTILASTLSGVLATAGCMYALYPQWTAIEWDAQLALPLSAGITAGFIAFAVCFALHVRAVRAACRDHWEACREESANIIADGLDKTDRSRFYYGIRPDDLSISEPFVLHLESGYVTGFSVEALLPEGPVTATFVLQQHNGKLSAEALDEQPHPQ